MLLGPDTGWEGHVMRVFELEPNGHTPRHQHAWPHINFIVSGRGSLYLNGQENEVTAGSYVFAPPGEERQFSNLSDEPFVLICIVPVKGHY